jgi:hypothetical protein
MILQYVLVKPVLALVVLILELTGTYKEGSFTPNGGYLWITIAYNLSITVSFCITSTIPDINRDISVLFISVLRRNKS